MRSEAFILLILIFNLKEEEERLEKERKEREEYEEYLKLKQNFEVQEEGYDADVTEEESQNKLQAFIDYIKVSI